MSYVKIWLHCVWGTKLRKPFLNKDIRKTVLEHIKENAKLKGIYIDTIDGHFEHIHCLLSLNPEQSLSNVIQLIKGESSFWINKNKLIKQKFGWAVEYFAVSLSEYHVPRVRNYIRNQEQHHQVKTWDNEFNEYIIKYGFTKLKE
jgi:putative transposase